MILLKMSISSVLLILFIVIIRILTINYLPKKMFKILWCLALYRLLIPFWCPSMLSIYTLFTRTKKTDMTAASVSIMEGMIHSTQFTKVPIERLFDPAKFFWVVILWIIGFGACTIFMSVCYQKLRYKFQTSIPIKNPDVNEWLDAHPMIRKISIRQSDRITAPLTYGIFYPVILLPKCFNWKSNSQLQYVLMHEYIHIKRFDVIAKFLLVAVLCIHWFNPFVWIMYILANQDLELCCDETVVRTFGETMKSHYALTLINMEERRSNFRNGLVSFYNNNYSKNAIQERIVAIMKIRKKSKLGIVAAAVLISITAIVFTTAAKPDNKIIGSIATQDTQGKANGLNIDFSKYEKFGITYDKNNGELRYNGELVKQFSDEIEPKVYDSYSNPNGTIALRVKRDSKNDIVGIEKIDDFEKGNLFQITETKNALTGKDASSHENNTESADLSQYEPYGIKYNQKIKNWEYNGMEVRVIADFKNGDIYFNNYGLEGAYLNVVRDENGKIKEVREIGKEEMDKLLSENQVKGGQYSIQKGS